MKIIINTCYGGFGISYNVLRRVGLENANWYDESLRHNPKLIELMENGENIAKPFNSQLKIVEIPDNAFYKIVNYDGLESVFYSATEIKEIE